MPFVAIAGDNNVKQKGNGKKSDMPGQSEGGIRALIPAFCLPIILIVQSSIKLHPPSLLIHHLVVVYLPR